MNLRSLASSLVFQFKTQLSQIADEQFLYTFHNVNVFATDDKPDVFLGGKLINIASYVYKYINEEERRELLPKLSLLIKLGLKMPLQTWGILNFLLGLHRFHQLGIYGQIVDSEDEQLINKLLDWHTFVNESDMSLIKKPTNYYGVAFGISCYRVYYLNENPRFRNLLLDKLLTHVKKYSDLQFMDETNGQGRFDRYSCLIPAEIATYLNLFNVGEDQQVMKMLRQSADIYLDLVNRRGNGFVYGRSIGVYGDTSALEVLSAAISCNLLSKEEIIRSHAYAITIVQKYLNFWRDEAMGGINMWSNGRRTDSYRFKKRIVGENFSTVCQIFQAVEHFASFDNEISEADIARRCNVYHGVRLYRFNNAGDQKAMAVIGIDDTVLQLPFVNGGSSYKDKCPYFPIPQTPELLEMPCDRSLPVFYPFLMLKNHKKVAALGNFAKIKAAGNNIEVLAGPFTLVAENAGGDDLSVPSQDMIANVEGLMKINYQINEHGFKIEFAITSLKDYQRAEIIFPFKSIVTVADKKISSKKITINVDNLTLEAPAAASSDYNCNHGAYRHLVRATTTSTNFSYEVVLGDKND